MKKIGIALGIIVGLVALVSVGLEMFLDLNAYKGRITAPMEQSLHRKVDIGNITYTLWRGLGAAAQNITIFEPDHSAAFISVKEIAARVNLLPLLSKKVEVSRILLDEPVVEVKRQRDGVWNFGDLLPKTPETPANPQPSPQKTPKPTPDPASQTAPETPPPAASQPPAEQPASAIQIAVNSFRLTDGKVRFVDDMVNLTTELSGITGDVTGFAANSPFNFELRADVDSGSQGKISASGQIGPLPADGSIENMALDVTATLKQIDLAHFSPYYQVAQAQDVATDAGKLDATIKLAGNVGKTIESTGNVSVGDVKVDVAGNVQNVSTTPKLDLTISSQEISWEKLLQLLPPGVSKPLKDLGISGLGTLKIQPKGALDNLSISGEFDLSKSGIRYQKLFAKPETAKTLLAFDITLQPNALAISSVSFTLGELTLNLAGNIADFKNPQIDVKLTSNSFPIEKLFGFFPELASVKEFKAGGAGELKASAKGAMDNLALNLALNLDQSELAYRDNFRKTPKSAANITIDAQLGKDQVTIKKFQTNLGSFQVNTSGKIANFADPQLDVKIETNAFDIQQLLAFFPQTAQKDLPKELKLAGNVSLKAAPVGSLKNLNLALSGALDMTQGAITFGEYFAKPKDLPGVITFDMTFTQDAIQIRQVQLNLNGVLLDITGAIRDWQKKAMLDLKIASNKFALNQLLPVSGMKMNPTGATELSLKLTGPMDHLTLDSVKQGKIQLSDVGLSLPQLTQPIRKLSALITLDGEQLTMKKFSAAIGETSLQGDATVSQFATAPKMTFSLYAPNLNVDELTGKSAQSLLLMPPSPFLFVAEKTTTPVATNSGSPPEKSSMLTQITAAGTLKINRGQASQVRFSDLSTEINLEKGIVNLNNLLCSLYNGKYQGQATLDFTTPDPKYAFQSELVRVDTNSVLTDGASLADVVYGALFANAAIQGQGFKTEQLVKSLSGAGELKIENGKFTTFDLWRQLASIFNLLGTLAQSDELTKIAEDLGAFPSETSFSRFEGHFELKDGEAGSSDMLLEIPEADMHITVLLDGKFGLDTSLDFIGKIRFAPQSKYYNNIEKSFKDFKQEDGSIELPFPIPIGGTLLKPKITLETAQKSIQKFAAELAKSAVKTEIKKQLEKTGENLLKDLFKKKK